MLNIESIYSSDSIDQSLSKIHTLNPQFSSVELIPIEYFPCMKQIKLLFLFLFFFFFAQNWNIWRRISTPPLTSNPPVVSRDSLIL